MCVCGSNVEVRSEEGTLLAERTALQQIIGCATQARAVQHLRLRASSRDATILATAYKLTGRKALPGGGVHAWVLANVHLCLVVYGSIPYRSVMHVMPRLLTLGC